ncbi:MAG: mechanosensitive ion channel protein MscS [Thermonema sp.]|uniref:mechanosensitive ion channel family protein n=1 Tax=Thermonema sp. TaxID=2231181 RepID=UPI0021DBA9FC|nr:mechanosensitive ion channel domain-containing protein [Thermonema sp.]GIV38545.1 MAG: mechanosensitive ion channel protein MscS [Thermonema sp.]
MNLNIEEILRTLTTAAKEFAPRFLGALVVLIIGWQLIRIGRRYIKKYLESSKIDPTVKPFLETVIIITLKVLLLVSVVSMLGVATTSILTMLGAAGVAVGLALQGSLSNLAGGILILIIRPFKVGDTIEAQGVLGVVQEIQIFNTYIKTFDNKVVILPNANLSNGNIINYSREPIRRVDMTFTCGYDDDFKKAKQLLQEIVENHPLVLKDPEPNVFLLQLGDSALHFAVRPWCKTEDYWTVYSQIHEAVKERFDREGISIPYPQRDVHLYQVSK